MRYNIFRKGYIVFPLCVIMPFITPIIYRHAVPWYTINLDLPAKQRWTQVGQDKKAGVNLLTHY